MDDTLVSKYNTCAKICGKVFGTLAKCIQEESIHDVQMLHGIGQEILEKECRAVYKKDKRGPSFPVSISLNNCVGSYIYDESKSSCIQPGDIIKIELGVNIGECIAHYGRTIERTETNELCECKSMETNERSETERIERLFDELQRGVTKLMKVGGTNDEVRILIEGFCSDNKIFPVENCSSYEHREGQYKTDESKYIILNYQKYYDDDDTLLTLPNDCFEFEEGEVYTIDLTVIPENSEQSVKYIEHHPPHIYRYNNFFYNLKLKNSREFCSKVKGIHGNNAFSVLPYTKDPRAKVGIRESVDNGILEPYNVLYTKPDVPVYMRKFTVIVGKEKGLALSYT